MTPMMEHYLSLKKKNPDCILLYRLGDFYECFFEDAELVSKELDIALTGRSCGEEKKAPMCGVPYHAIDSYLPKLVSKGYKVAICEQLTKAEPGKMVDRDIIRIVTAGTVIESEMLDSCANNFLASIYLKKGVCSISYLDISTGDFYSELLDGENLLAKINDELLRIKPSEIIANSLAKEFISNLASIVTGQLPKINSFYEWAYTYNSAYDTIKKQFKIASLNSFDISDKEECICACGALLEYCNQTQKRELNHLKPIKFIRNDLYLHLDNNARRNLELVVSMKDNKRKGSLLSVLDETKTPMGARFFKTALEQPFQSEIVINERLDAVESIVNNALVKESLLNVLDEISDIERLSSKLVYGSITPKDCLNLKTSLRAFPKIKQLITKLNSSKIQRLNDNIVDFSKLVDLLERTIKEDAGIQVKDGNYIKEGFNKTLDEYRNAKVEGAKWLANLERVEIEQTGIKNLKIKYNKVFGYVIEVSKSNIDKVPNRYIRRQTIANNERYTTDELKEIENKILNSEENALRLESEIFSYVKSVLNDNISLILNASSAIAELDFYVSLANVAVKYNYTKPIVSNQLKELTIVGGRHPVVENIMKDQFIPNDIFLNDSSERIMILTGPNMAGKSTYMRQIALIVLMAHIGSFVPCTKASMPTFDRIFTRVGASDDLAFGQSTFMVEMNEVSTILNNATDRSLVILDEVGRGTSTYDGLSIAWAISEYLSNNLKCKTLFSTHYHELTELEGMLDGVKNYKIDVKENADGIVFLRKIVKGGASKSFGIEVAKLAGIPKNIILRAKEILKKLEMQEAIKLKEVNDIKIEVNDNDEELQKLKELKDAIMDLDINKITPFESLQILNDIKSKLNGDNF